MFVVQRDGRIASTGKTQFIYVMIRASAVCWAARTYNLGTPHPLNAVEAVHSIFEPIIISIGKTPRLPAQRRQCDLSALQKVAI